MFSVYLPVERLSLYFQALELPLDEISQRLPHFQLKRPMEKVSVTLQTLTQQRKQLRTWIKKVIKCNYLHYFCKIVVTLLQFEHVIVTHHNCCVPTWLLFSARSDSTSSLTLNGFPTRTVIL